MATGFSSRSFPADRMRNTGLLLFISLSLSACGACGGVGSETRLRVLAASVFLDVTTELTEAFSIDRPGVVVETSMAGSQVLRYQIEQGAPADVFMSGHLHHMEVLERAGLIEQSRVFARGELVVIVPIDNPAGIESFDDLPSAGSIVLGERNSPVGRYTRELLSNTREVRGEDFVARIESRVVSEESNVRLVRAKIEMGEADAAIVYRSDAVSSDRLGMVEIPAELAVPIDFHVGVITRSSNKDAAMGWMDMLNGSAGRATLERHGFEPVR